MREGNSKKFTENSLDRPLVEANRRTCTPCLVVEYKGDSELIIYNKVGASEPVQGKTEVPIVYSQEELVLSLRSSTK